VAKANPPAYITIKTIVVTAELKNPLNDTFICYANIKPGGSSYTATRLFI
jgi:hypothetical protein